MRSATSAAISAAPCAGSSHPDMLGHGEDATARTQRRGRNGEDATGGRNARTRSSGSWHAGHAAAPAGMPALDREALLQCPVQRMADFDPDAAASPGSGIFGLPHGPDAAAVVLVPVPFDATTSYGGGAAEGPDVVLAASRQVDLYDVQTGRPYRHGIAMLPSEAWIAASSREARALAEPIIAQGGVEAFAAGPERERHAAALARVNEAGATVNEWLRRTTGEWLQRGKIVGVVGGDHAAPFGALQAISEHMPGLGILHVDAHADLRHEYEGFVWSHASIMDNVVRRLPGVSRIVQVGVRDLSDGEAAATRASGGRVLTHFDLDWRRRLASGESWLSLCGEAVRALPQDVWVSFDIDGLDPALCPGTGTPVPGGLSFTEACLLLESLHRGGKRIVGFDLCEVAPGTGDGVAAEWNGNVGARVLYKLCGFALLDR